MPLVEYIFMANKPQIDNQGTPAEKGADTPKQKRCFFVTPIGSEGSEERQRSDTVLEFILKPAIAECGYDLPVIRADQMSTPGSITTQVIEELLTCDLVVADLSGHNPNVFYELAVRHAVAKPVVQIIQKGDRIPFDVTVQRTLFYDHRDFWASRKATEELIHQIRAAEADPSKVDTPLSGAILQLNLLKGDPAERADAAILNALQRLQSEVGSLRNQMNHTTSTAQPRSSSRLVFNPPAVPSNNRLDLFERAELAAKVFLSNTTSAEYEKWSRADKIDQILKGMLEGDLEVRATYNEDSKFRSIIDEMVLSMIHV